MLCCQSDSDAPSPIITDSIELNMNPYMFISGGDTAFLDVNGTKIITENLPPVTSSTQSKVTLKLPHQTYMSPTSESRTQSSISVEGQILEAVAATPDVYPELCRIDIVFKIYPNIALPSGATVTLQGPLATKNCNAIDTSKGTGRCIFSGASCNQLFAFSGSYQQNIQLTVGVPAWTLQDTVLVNLHPNRIETTSATSTTLLRATVPSYPMMNSDKFTMKVFGNTDRQDLDIFKITVDFDTSVVQYNTYTRGTNIEESLAPVLTNRQNSITRIEINAKVPTGTVVNGENVLLVTIDFGIVQGISDKIAITSAEYEMLNTQSGQIGKSKITIDDACGGSTPLGSACMKRETVSTIIQLQTTGMVKYVVLKPDGTSTSTYITGHTWYSNYNIDQGTIAAENMNCIIIGSGLTSSGCAQIAPSSSTPADPWGIVKATYYGLESNTSIGTYTATSVEIVTDKSTIEPIGTGVYEVIRIRKMVIFVSAAGFPSKPVDVSNTIYDFVVTASNNNVLISTDNFFVSGLSLGNAVISASAAQTGTVMGITYQSASVTVENSQASQIISLKTITGVSWAAGRLAPQLIDNLVLLTKEGDTQFIIPVLYPSGLFPTTSQNIALIQNIASSNALVYKVTQEAGTYRYWKGLIPPGALDNPIQGLVELSINKTAYAISTSPVYVNISLPVPTGATLACGYMTLAVKDDAAATAGYKTSQTNSFTLSVKFSDGTTKSFLNDNRATYGFVQNEYMATISRPTSSAPTVTAPINSPAHTITIKANVVTSNTVTSNTITITIVMATDIVSTVTTGSVSRVHCAGSIFQGTSISTIMSISNGASHNLAGKTGLAYSLSNGALRSVTATFFRGASPGTSVITTSYSTLSTTNSVEVLDTSVKIAALAVTLPAFSTQLPGEVKTLSVKMTLSDGSVENDVISSYNGYSSATTTDQLLVITSGQPGAIEVLDPGRIRLLNNSNSLVSITVSSRGNCEGQSVISNAKTMAANLQPNVQGDFDIGSITGIPIPTITDAWTTISVRIRADSNKLAGFTVFIYYDSQYMEIDKERCSIATAFKDNGGCVTTTEGVIELNGATGNAPATNANLIVAAFYARSKNIGQSLVQTRFTGFVKIATFLGGYKVENMWTVASNTPISIETGSTRRGLDILASTESIYPLRRNNVEPLPGPLYGDTNNDNNFDVSDILFMLEYYTSRDVIGCPENAGNGCQSKSTLTQWQLKQLKPVGDPTSELRDIAFTVGVFVNRLYFFTNASFISDENAIRAEVRLVDRKNTPVINIDSARVLFVFNTSQHQLPWSPMVNSSYDTQKNMHLAYTQLCTDCSEPGWFKAHALATKDTPASSEMFVGVVFSIETFEIPGQGASNRRFPFYSTTVAEYTGFSKFTPYTTISIVMDPNAIITTTPSPETTPLESTSSVTTTTPSPETTPLESTSSVTTTTPSPETTTNTTTTPTPILTGKSTYRMILIFDQFIK